MPDLKAGWERKMAYTVNRQGEFISIIPELGNSADFSHSAYFPDNPEGIVIKSIECVPSQANDRFTLRTHSITGPAIIDHLSLDGISFEKKYDNGALVKLYIDTSEQVQGGTLTSWKIILWVG